MTERHSPSVHYPIRRPFFWRKVLLVVWCIACVGLLVWLLQDSNQRGQLWVKVVAAGLALGLAAFGIRKSWHDAVCGYVCWDGRAWYWQDGAGVNSAVHTVQVLLDLQTVMLVKWVTVDGRRCDGWVHQLESTDAWGDFRRAVYSSSHYT